jgi:hypothetical protein
VVKGKDISRWEKLLCPLCLHFFNPLELVAQVLELVAQASRLCEMAGAATHQYKNLVGQTAPDTFLN